MVRKDTGPFKPNERVLVPHVDKYYEAKVLKCKKQDDGMWYYLLHYNGWNKKWDEWVEAPGITKFDEALVESGKKGSGGGKRGGGPRKKMLNDFGSVAVAAANGLAGGFAAGGENGDAGPVQLDVTLPPALKRILLEDWERWRGGGAGGGSESENGPAGGAGGAGAPPQYPPLHLPATPSVSDILTSYCEAATRVADASVTPEEELANGLRIYFDKALPRALLYAGERPAAEKALASGVTPSSIFGGEHLLRLFVQLPKLLPPPPSYAPDAYSIYEGRLAHVLEWMAARRDALFPRSGGSRAGSQP